MKRVKLFLIISLLAVKASAQPMPLYKDSVPNSIGKLAKEDQPTIEIYPAAKGKETGTGIVVFPGGAYVFLAELEAEPIARAFAARGITAFLVKSGLPKDTTMRDKSMGPLMDAQQAMKTARLHAKEYGLEKIGVIGYSAGGHLASTLGTHFEPSYIPNKENLLLRPDFMLLVYPVISMDTTLTHKGSRRNLLGKTPTDEKVLFFSNQKQVTGNTPPTYLTHTGDDRLVNVDNSIEFYQALVRNKVDAELHLYPKGDHGFTLRQQESEWIDPMIAFLKKLGMYEQKK